ncbi:carbon monoxide dehydrogenase [Bradyrhizobium pachyrhizi]|uniref:Carbon monoxide dehydrogenase n=1 Tax=Bradyrhizobium pachyrhizi TaxID=280333 RepID=A0A844SM52_9BRAD|nr:FAD binding domain-containing protein [Bradyrhizobium pachyrhizi]MVT64502.1 carbon monoxide dehydrogenase [Bradyrhizobium pachyrhizi]
MKPAAFTYSRARSVADTVEQLAAANGEAKVFAGGQSLGPMLNLRLARPGVLIDIRHIAELRRVEASDQHVAIGATVTHADIEDGGFEDVTCGMLPFVAHGIAYRAIRNRGTVGGSLAHSDPAADWISTMVALDATIVAQSAKEGARRIAAADFIAGAFTPTLGAVELVTAIELRRFSAGARWGYYKVCRKTGEFAKAIGICVMDEAAGVFKVVAGATEGRPIVLGEASRLLREAGPDRAITAVPDEIGQVLAHLTASHRQQMNAAVCRSLAQLSKGRAKA